MAYGIGSVQYIDRCGGDTFGGATGERQREGEIGSGFTWGVNTAAEQKSIINSQESEQTGISSIRRV